MVLQPATEVYNSTHPPWLAARKRQRKNPDISSQWDMQKNHQIINLQTSVDGMN
jgi:hypothetical protein